MDAIKFLRKWNPTGAWVLTCIQVDRKGIETKTFYPHEEKKLKEWLDLWNGKRNIYFHANSVMHDLEKKAERTDIKSVDWLHVDVDPREGKDIGTEREAILSQFLDNRPKGIPEPTCIIFSGGGYQAFWRLKEPIQVNGDLGLAEDAKRFNQQLEIIFSADNCHNIDRIMRLPGTYNIPDARKLKKGRKRELASVLQFNDNVYPLKTFTPAASVQSKGAGTFTSSGMSPQAVKISGNVERLVGVDDLDEYDVPDRLKVAIVQGRHPDEPKEGDNSRSAWVFDVACNLVRFKVPDEKIFSILTDPEFGISESILEQKGNVEQYTIRQIERAKEWAIDPQLVKLNEQYAVIMNTGGKCRIVEEIMDEGLHRTRLTKISFEDFRNSHMHIKVQHGETADGKPKFVPLGKWWLENENRRQYKTITFAPGKEIVDAYNLWKGFSCSAIPGNCDLFLEHLKDNICSGDQSVYDYLLGWMARAVQQPASPGEVAIVLRGGRGVGKSLFVKQFGSLFGRHFLHVSNSGHLVGNFNSHLRDAVVLFADEAFYANDKKHESVLKTLITEETIPIEAKGVDVETAPNYVHLLMASNGTHVVPAGGDERRFCVLDVSKERQQDTAYFSKLIDQMKNGGKEALLHFLMTYDIEKFDVRNVPATEALQEQKLLSLSSEEEWWYQKLQEGRLIPDHTCWEQEIVKEYLVDDFIENARRFNITRRGTATSLGRFLKKFVPQIAQKQKEAEIEKWSGDGFTYTEKKRVYHYVFPSLEDCRAQWCEVFGAEKWMEEESGEQQEVPF